jgi:hypothetical protein
MFGSFLVLAVALTSDQLWNVYHSSKNGLSRDNA